MWIKTSFNNINVSSASKRCVWDEALQSGSSLIIVISRRFEFVARCLFHEFNTSILHFDRTYFIFQTTHVFYIYLFIYFRFRDKRWWATCILATYETKWSYDVTGVVQARCRRVASAMSQRCCHGVGAHFAACFQLRVSPRWIFTMLHQYSWIYLARATPPLPPTVYHSLLAELFFSQYSCWMLVSWLCLPEWCYAATQDGPHVTVTSSMLRASCYELRATTS